MRARFALHREVLSPPPSRGRCAARSAGRRGCGAHNRDAGVSLLEMLAALAVIAVMATAVVVLGDFGDSAEEAAGERLMRSLAEARREAMLSGAVVGFSDDPGHELAKKQQTGFGGVLSFQLKGAREEAWRFIDATRMISITANLGDVKTTVTHPATTTHGRLSPEDKERAGITVTTRGVVANRTRTFDELMQGVANRIRMNRMEAHWRRRRMAAPSSAERLSFTWVSSL